MITKRDLFNSNYDIEALIERLSKHSERRLIYTANVLPSPQSSLGKKVINRWHDECWHIEVSKEPRTIEIKRYGLIKHRR